MRTVRPLTPLLVLALAIVPAGAAQAGGWATVEADVPAGVSAGEPVRMELLVKQHGRTPMTGVTPSVRIENDAGAVREFRALPTGKPGVYVAEVTYPVAGTWRTRLFDGFTDVTPHRLPPIDVAAAGGGAGASGGTFPSPQVVAIAVVALLFAAAWIAVGRRERYLPAP